MTSDETRGKSALAYFHNESLSYEGYEMTLEELIKALQKKRPGFLDGFGFGVRMSDLSESGIKRAMVSYAEQAEGRLPANPNDFFNALIGEATKGNFIDAISYTAVESVKDIAVGAQKVGDAVIKTGGILTGILPVIVVGAVLFIVAMRSKQLAGV